MNHAPKCHCKDSRPNSGRRAELQTYPPASVDWLARAFAAADVLIPWLVGTAPELKSHVEKVLNSPHRLRTQWTALCNHASLPTEQIKAFDREPSYAKILLEFVGGEVVSIIVTADLLAAFPGSGLKSNGKSDYPDLFLMANEYANLPEVHAEYQRIWSSSER